MAIQPRAAVLIQMQLYAAVYLHPAAYKLFQRLTVASTGPSSTCPSFSADGVNLLLGHLMFLKQKCSNTHPVKAVISPWTFRLLLVLVSMCERLMSYFGSLLCPWVMSNL